MISKKEKMFRLLQYLKKYTDKNNPSSMPLIDYYFERKGLPNFFGSPSAKRKVKREIVKELAEILNTDLYGNPLPEDERVIVYDGYGEPSDGKREYICNLYYAQPFSEGDIRTILDSIDQNVALSAEEKDTLKKKVKKHISNKNYESTDWHIRRGLSPIEKKRYLKNKEQSAYGDYFFWRKTHPDYDDEHESDSDDF